jgi:pantoate--beta-alanine ligase
MLVFRKISEIKNFIKEQKLIGKKIAFVPTMGALHFGHLSLIKEAKKSGDLVIASIFVNRAQFNDLNDFEKYPRQEENDLEKLASANIDAVFLPSQDEIFASDFSFKLIATSLVDCLCGKARAGHFDGVALIVSKLFNIIKPDFAIFGEKDFQQLTIIKKLVRDLNFDVEIIASPTIRENSGLAMSSRNERLSENAKIKAAEIFKALNEIKKNPENLEKIKEDLLKNGFEKIDYLEIRDAENLNLIENFQTKKQARIFIAIYLEGVRLIDNIAL